MPGAVNDPLDILRALADDDRLRIVGMLALRPRDPADLALLLGLTEAEVQHHVRILLRERLVHLRGGVLSLDTAPLRELMAATAEPKPPPEMIPDGATAEERKVLGSFFEGRRLVKIPSQQRKLLVVLRRLAALFDEARIYSEKEVNEILRAHHPDVAALRRALVDYGLVSREGGRYRITSGPNPH